MTTGRGVVYLSAIAGAVLVAPAMAQAVTAQADQVIEGCHWSDTAQAWLYADGGGLCRSTGEDPTTDSAGLPACADHRIAIPGIRPGTVTCVDQI